MTQFKEVGICVALPQKPWRTLTIQDFESILHDEVREVLPELVMRKEKELMVGSLSLCGEF